MNKLLATLLSVVLLTSTASPAPAEPAGDWSAVKNSAGQEVAIKTTDGVTSFGILRSADDSVVAVLLAAKEGLAAQETLFRRDEIEKVWRARLRFGERNTRKGAWIGAAAGLGAAFAYASLGRHEDAPIGVGLFPAYGAGVGAFVGALSRKGHKKGKLIYGL